VHHNRCRQLNNSTNVPKRGAVALELAVVAGACLALQLPIFDRWLSALDEGHVLWFSDIIARGGDLYGDATLYPLPGAFYALAMVFRVFEPSMLLTRWIVMLESTLFAMLVYLFVRPLLSRSLAFATLALLLLYRVWAFPHWHHYSYSTTALLLLLGATLAMARFFRSGDRRTLGWAGLLFGLGVACKQDYGAGVLLALGGCLVVYARTASARPRLLPLFVWLLAPACAVGLAIGAYFLSQGLLGELIQQTVFNHIGGIQHFDYPTTPGPLPILAQDPALRGPAGLYAHWPGIVMTLDFRELVGSPVYRETALLDTLVKLFYYLPYLLGLVGALRLWRRREGFRDEAERELLLRELLLLATALCYLLVFTVGRPQDYLHLAVLYWPFLCLAVVIGRSTLAARPRLAAVVVACSLVPAALAIGYTGRLVYELRDTYTGLVRGERGGVYALPAEAETLGELLAYTEANIGPDETVAVVPYFPLLHFLVQRSGPHPSGYIVWPHADYEDRDRRIIDAMEEKGTDTVFYNHSQFITFPPFEEFAPEFYDHLVDRFATRQVFSNDLDGYKIAALVRESAPREGRPLLTPDTEGVSLRIEGADAAPRELSGDAAAGHFALERWPFRPALALRPTARGGRTVLSIPVEVPAGGRLRTAVGVHPKKWFDYPPSWVEFRVELVDGERREALYTRRLDPHKRFEDRSWFDVEIPLDAWAGRSVRIELSTATDRERGQELAMGGWGDPRIVSGTPPTERKRAASPGDPPLTAP